MCPTKLDSYDDELKRAHVRQVLGLRRSSLLLLLYVMFYVVYLMTGGLVFAALEAPAEQEVKARLLVARETFLTTYPCVSGLSSLSFRASSMPPSSSTDGSTNHFDESLEELIQAVVKASNRGVSAAKNVSGEPNWSFGQSLFFSSTVVTTIGYGHVTPLSKGGKVFCIVYAMLGIPLTLVLLTALVERLMLPVTVLLQFLNTLLGHLYQPFNIRLLHLFLVAALLIGVFMLAPAAVFAALEPDWDFLDSFYYCFISLTTIGLGDYIPGDSPSQPYRPFYKIATTAYLILGLTVMMLTLTVFYDIPQLNFGLFFLMRSDETTGDPEKARLQTPGALGPNYSQQLDDAGARRAVVRVKSRRDDSPSPDDTTPVHARP